MMNDVFLLIGVGPAGTSAVLKMVRPVQRVHRPFCPEVHLSEWDRKGLPEVARIVGETVLSLLALEHPATFANYPSLVPPDEDEGKSEEQIFAEELAAQAVEPVTALAPFTFDGEMRERSLAVGVGFDNRTLRLVPFAGEKANGMPVSIDFDSMAALEPPEAWAHLGQIILQKVAAMHPDAFRPFDSFAPLVGGLPC